MIGRRCSERPEPPAADGQAVCVPCALDLRLRDAFERGRHEGWSACHGLVRQIDDDVEHG